MMIHPGEGTLQAYLDGEVQSEPREALDRHLDGCRDCRETLEELDSIAKVTTRALAVVDRVPLATDAAKWAVRRSGAVRRSRTHRTRVAAAASMILLLGAGWVAAMPGSPIRGWWADRSAGQVPALAEPLISDAIQGQRSGVSQQLLDGEASVSFEGVPTGAWVEVQVAESDGAGVSVPAGSSFETGAGRIHVEVGGLEGDLMVELPDDAVRAEVLVNGQPVFRKVGTDVSYPGPAPVSVNDGSVRFQVEGAP